MKHQRRFCKITDCGLITLQGSFCEKHWTEREEKRKDRTKAYHKKYHEEHKKLTGKKIPKDSEKQTMGKILKRALNDERFTR